MYSFSKCCTYSSFIPSCLKLLLPTSSFSIFGRLVQAVGRICFLNLLAATFPGNYAHISNKTADSLAFFVWVHCLSSQASFGFILVEGMVFARAVGTHQGEYSLAKKSSSGNIPNHSKSFQMISDDFSHIMVLFGSICMYL